MKNKNTFFKKRSVKATLLLFGLLSLAFIPFANASPSPSYAPAYDYSKDKTYLLTGNLSRSGPDREDLEDAIRPSYSLWNDVRFYDAINGGWYKSTPTGDYLPTTQFDILETMKEDNFTGRSGYHIIPNNEVDKVAKWANGNENYLKYKVLHPDPNNYYLKSSNYYGIGDQTTSINQMWIRFESAVYLSGGDTKQRIATEPATAKNRGLTYPVFETTFNTTPWPIITDATAYEGKNKSELLSMATGRIHVDSTSYAMNHSKHKTWIVQGEFSESEVLAQLNKTVEDSGTAKDKSRFDKLGASYYKEMDAATTKFNFSGSFYLRDIKKILNTTNAHNTLTVIVSDPFDRISVKTVSFDVLSDSMINLRATDIVSTPDTVRVDEPATLKVEVENTSAKVDIEDTYLDWYVNGELQKRVGPISINAGEKKWIDGLKIDSVPKVDLLHVKAIINPDHDRPEQEQMPDGSDPWIDNSIEKDIPFESHLNYYMKSVSGSTIALGQEVTTRVSFGRENLRNDDDTLDKKTKVHLLVQDKNGNRKEVAVKTVNLDTPGTELTDFFEWDSSILAPGSYTLVATINIPSEEGEVTFEDNIMTAGLTIMSVPANIWCSSTETIAKAISGTYQECVSWKYEVRPSGSRHKVCKRYETRYYYEYFDAGFNGGKILGSFVDEKADEINGTDVKLISTGQNSIKAGQGFHFTVNSDYSEDTGKTGNIKDAVATFTKVDGTYETIHLIPINRSTNHVTWAMPLAWVPKHGDDVIYNENGNPGSSDPTADDYYYPGGRAYYTSLSATDGDITFKVNLSAKGVNNLLRCLVGAIKVKDNIMNDFYVRQVNSEDPFPSEVTEPKGVWKDNVSTLTDFNDWINYQNGTRAWPGTE